jgi:L-seryl-tRNA(Ser) seleniumtransferase
VRGVRACGAAAEVIEGRSTVGGGSLPGETIPTALCAIGGSSSHGARQSSARPTGPWVDVAVLAVTLRGGAPPVVARVYRDRLLLDPRTVDPADDELVLRALCEALSAQSRT